MNSFAAATRRARYSGLNFRLGDHTFTTGPSTSKWRRALKPRIQEPQPQVLESGKLFGSSVRSQARRHERCQRLNAHGR